MQEQAWLHGLAAQLPQVWREGIRVEAALSGGLDSVVLLHLLRRLREVHRFELGAVHVHHGLQTAADEWARFCAQLCTDWQVPLRVEKVRVAADGSGVEAAARQARYRVFAASPAEVVALAHHADDQVETFFLAALRGGGLRALSAMPRERLLAGKCLWRPLLSYSREQLAAYAARHHLPFVEDPSNGHQIYLRNWLRLSGLPAWRAHLPHLARHISASVAQLQEEAALLAEIEAADAALVCRGGVLDLALWRGLGSGRRRRQLLNFARENGLGGLNRAMLADADRVLCRADSGRWLLAGGSLLAHQGRLYALEAAWRQTYPPGQEGCVQALFSDGLWQLRPSENGLAEECFARNGRIRPARSGERMAVAGGSKTVKKILQEAGVPPLLRTDWPVLEIDGECAALIGICAARTHAVRGGLLPYWPPLMRWVMHRRIGETDGFTVADI
ncbi:tRNA lysidine(34) synthetase TilS [Neisseria leonii]|uniref:tRNA(Ile)-lysidine synthase n=1 Tax=Neisseria leonii TaxID=2995413 RepID=A0A9X4EAH7_9NEIS|nr:tRNA lysidine(34) synthetase TilS [Neisseria sp. 51.81]MDD9328403.1 tRNA lysidine(34) synthetase TilS [Neisseria sp. 51.81]